ncbi:hypothetical protein [Paenibacillus sp. MMO-177]|uniref:hypothetical protein n=1 Tax=Paenibacillus sp. MMO-177 TaxID=3081289 RepID=UPI00301B3EF0
MKKMLGLLLSLTLILALVAPGASAKTKKDQDAVKDKNNRREIRRMPFRRYLERLRIHD